MNRAQFNRNQSDFFFPLFFVLLKKCQQPRTGQGQDKKRQSLGIKRANEEIY